MAGFRVVIAGLEVGEMTDELLEVEPVVVAFDVEHAIHDEVTHGVHVDLGSAIRLGESVSFIFRLNGRCEATITNEKYMSMGPSTPDLNLQLGTSHCLQSQGSGFSKYEK